ncbi:MAG: hypothetical protein WBV90_00175, partial [Terrimicrobiaceae bacterium]
MRTLLRLVTSLYYFRSRLTMRLGLCLFALFLAASIARGENSFFQPSFRSPRQSEIIYFMLPDRFN